MQGNKEGGQDTDQGVAWMYMTDKLKLFKNKCMQNISGDLGQNLSYQQSFPPTMDRIRICLYQKYFFNIAHGLRARKAVAFLNSITSCLASYFLLKPSH